MGCIIERIVIALLAFLASIAGAVQERGMPEPTTAVVIETTQTQHTQSVEIVETTVFESETAVFVENWQKTEEYVPQTAPSWQDGFVHYRIAGVTPPYEWQWYLYGRLADRGLEWWYPYAMCQIYQESNWNQYSTNGKDHGLCQFKGVYWDGWAQSSGIPGADIWDVYAQLTVYVWMMGNNLAAAGGNVGQALSLYYLGYAGWSDEYVGHVIKWLDYLEVVR